MNIIQEIVKTCDRQDCRLAFDEYGFTNSAGYTSGVACWSCKREWSVFKPSNWEPAVYDREGNLTNPPPPVEIKERVRQSKVGAPL